MFIQRGPGTDFSKITVIANGPSISIPVSMHRGCININELGRQEYYMVDLSYSLL